MMPKFEVEEDPTANRAEGILQAVAIIKEARISGYKIEEVEMALRRWATQMMAESLESNGGDPATAHELADKISSDSEKGFQFPGIWNIDFGI